MCHDDSMRTEAVACGDAGEMDLFVWEPTGAPVGSVLLIQEIFGVGPYIRAVAERLAVAGYVVGAPDVFWRFAPNWASDHTPEGLQASIAEVSKLDGQQAVADCVAALAHLGAIDGVDQAPAVLGFCLGGTLAWGVAAVGRPSCCVSYYGSGVPSMIDLIDQVTCPTLFHFGSDDPYLPNEGVEALVAAIAGRDGFQVNIEHAGHAFDNHESEMFHQPDAAKAAWAKTTTFLAEHAT